jgi:hypothetical protein
MIPKVIHYCWFGNGRLSPLAEQCINSWRKFCPGYEIKRWDETNFDLHSCKYVEEAYKTKNYAFVADYARFKILYEHGGVYFDTDVELVKPIDEYCDGEGFMACEKCYYFNNDSLLSMRKLSRGVGIAIASGLGLASTKKNDMYKRIIDDYTNSNFLLYDCFYDKSTVVERVTAIFSRIGFDKFYDDVQVVGGIKIYPSRYFSGKNNITGKIEISNDTVAIHHGAGSWLNKEERSLVSDRKKYKGHGKIAYLVGCALMAPRMLSINIKHYGIKKTIFAIALRCKLKKHIGVINIIDGKKL